MLDSQLTSGGGVPTGYKSNHINRQFFEIIFPRLVNNSLDLCCPAG